MTGAAGGGGPQAGHRILKLRFVGSVEVSDDEGHEMGERVVAELVTDEPITYDGTELVDES